MRLLLEVCVVDAGVNWQRLPLDDMVAIASGLGAQGLAGIVGTIARDGWAQWAGGLPDLLLWSAEGVSTVASHAISTTHDPVNSYFLTCIAFNAGKQQAR